MFYCQSCVSYFNNLKIKRTLNYLCVSKYHVEVNDWSGSVMMVPGCDGVTLRGPALSSIFCWRLYFLRKLQQASHSDAVDEGDSYNGDLQILLISVVITLTLVNHIFSDQNETTVSAPDCHLQLCHVRHHQNQSR